MKMEHQRHLWFFLFYGLNSHPKLSFLVTIFLNQGMDELRKGWWTWFLPSCTVHVTIQSLFHVSLSTTNGRQSSSQQQSAKKRQLGRRADRSSVVKAGVKDHKNQIEYGSRQVLIGAVPSHCVLEPWAGLRHWNSPTTDVFMIINAV